MAEKEVTKAVSDSVDNLIADIYTGTTENTYLESAYDYKSQRRPYNPDDLYQKAGDYSIYEEMSFDDQVNTVVQLKLDLVLGSGWTIKVDKEGDQKIADELYGLLDEDMDCTLDEQIEEFLRAAYIYGFSLPEKVFKFNDKNQLTLKYLKTRYPNSWLIHTDQQGNVTKYEQRTANKDINVNPKSLIHYVNNPQFGSPYGVSDLRQAYKPWFAKSQIIKYYGIFLEKYAGPIPHAKYKDGTPEAVIDQMFEHIRRFQQKTALVYNERFEVGFLENNKDGSAYEKAVNLFNMLIGRSLLMPDLAGFTGAQTSGGAYSLGEQQLSVLIKHVEKRRRILERLINKHIIWPMVYWNYGNMDFYPKFCLNPVSQDNTNEYAKIFIEAAKGRLYKPSDEEINHFRSLIKFPEGEVERSEYQAGDAGFSGLGVNKNEDPKQAQGKEEEETNENGKGEGDKKPDEKYTADCIDKGCKPREYIYKPPVGDYHKKVDFKKIENQLDANENEIKAELDPIVDEMFEDLYLQIERKKILGDNPNIERIEDLKLKNLKKIELVFRKHFKQLWVNGKIQARSELLKGNYAQPLPDEEFLRVLDAELYKYIGDYRYNVLGLTKNEIIKAIKDGRPLSSLINVLDDKGKALSETSLERWSRTKTTEVYNKGRKAFFDESGVVSAYQYSAIMDGVTTEICSGLNGKIFRATKDLIPTPPMHFNCRSLLIPITIYEEYTETEKIGDTPIDEWIKNKTEKTGLPIG